VRTPTVEKLLILVVKYIDLIIGDWSGKIFRWLIIPMTGGLMYEVFARYLFNAPTIWAYDLTYFLYGTHFMFGATYALRTGGHIRTDFLYEKWSIRTQGTVDAACYFILFFPGLFFFLLAGLDEALLSISILEKSDASPWRPPIYPLKCVIPLAVLLLLLQGISESLKSVYAVWRARWL